MSLNRVSTMQFAFFYVNYKFNVHSEKYKNYNILINEFTSDLSILIVCVCTGK